VNIQPIIQKNIFEQSRENFNFFSFIVIIVNIQKIVRKKKFVRNRDVREIGTGVTIVRDDDRAEQ
jgi:hypothetical protein